MPSVGGSARMCEPLVPNLESSRAQKLLASQQVPSHLVSPLHLCVIEGIANVLVRHGSFADQTKRILSLFPSLLSFDFGGLDNLPGQQARRSVTRAEPVINTGANRDGG
jgi:hypothetical protein